MEGIHLETLPEEDEEDDSSLVQFFRDVNVDLNASMSSYLGSRASNSRVCTHNAAITVAPGTPVMGSSEIASSQPPVNMLPSNSEEGRSESVTSRPNDGSHSSSVFKSLGGSDSVALLQTAKDLQALLDVILSTYQHISQCGLNSSPLSALHSNLTVSQKEMGQLLDGAYSGRGLLRKSAKVELMRFVLRTIHAILSALVEQVGLLKNETSFVTQLKQDIEAHQFVLMNEQRELQEMIRATREELLHEKKLSMKASKEELDRREATKLTSPPVKHVQVTKYVHSGVPGRAEVTALVRNQQEQQRLEKQLLRSEQERKGLKENLLRTKTELSATRESLEVLKNQHEALQRSSAKTIADLQRKLHLAEEEAARSKMALSIQKHKSGQVSKLADRRGKDLSHASLEAAVSEKTVGHLSNIVHRQQQREESLRQQLALSQSAVREREERLRQGAVSLVQQKRREQAMAKTAKWQVLKSKGDKLAKSPLGQQLQVPCLQSHHETTKEHQSLVPHRQHKPPPHLSLDIEELRELAHFEDPESAVTALKWLNDTLS